MPTLTDFEYDQTRDEEGIGSKWTGIRRFAIPRGDVETYRDDFEVDSGNVWPGTADTWLNSTDYEIGDLCQGDGSPDSYIYEATAQSGPSYGGAVEPPDSAKWSRRMWEDYIGRYKLTRDMPNRPGFSHLTCWYKKPSPDRVLRDNPGNAIIEVELSGQSQRVLQEPAGSLRVIEGPAEPSVWADDVEYDVDDLVDYDGQSYVAVLGAEEWDATVTYSTGDIVQDEGVQYSSDVDNNLNNDPPHADWTALTNEDQEPPDSN